MDVYTKANKRTFGEKIENPFYTGSILLQFPDIMYNTSRS